MMDAFKTHGAFSWCELATSDVEGAKKFYGALLGWEFDAMDTPNGQYNVDV